MAKLTKFNQGWRVQLLPFDPSPTEFFGAFPELKKKFSTLYPDYEAGLAALAEVNEAINRLVNLTQTKTS